MSSWIKRIGKIFEDQDQDARAGNVELAGMDAAIFNSYAPVIKSVIPYFGELTIADQWRFVRRTHQFQQLKKFHYVGLKEDPVIPVLVSASATQVTFGLKNYLLPHFTDIYITGEAYQMESDEELYVGHVAPDGIYLSWKHFLFGYADRYDNINVGIHEMAHALLYNNYFAQYGQNDPHFRFNYEKFSKSTGPILADVITHRRSYLRSYAFSNMHEFWAVSVEAFFEGPAELKKNMPALYQAICHVLNQDLTMPKKIINPDGL